MGNAVKFQAQCAHIFCRHRHPPCYRCSHSYTLLPRIALLEPIVDIIIHAWDGSIESLIKLKRDAALSGSICLATTDPHTQIPRSYSHTTTIYICDCRQRTQLPTSCHVQNLDIYSFFLLSVYGHKKSKSQNFTPIQMDSRVYTLIALQPMLTRPF